ncbi:MAG: tetratricopeptide repeat protein [Gemmataceae bacterium]|nr:tetratricopeptide repeat protein [Gemmataceae bacterium]
MRRRVFLGLLALSAVGGGAWWWFGKGPPPPEPPLPPGITDPEVDEVVRKGRDKLLADKRSGAAWGEYGTLLLAHLFDKEADQCLEVAARLDPAEPRWPYARAHIALKRDPERAVGLLTAATDAARKRPEYRTVCAMTLAETFLERGEVDRAAELFRQELEVAPGEERALFGLGTVAAVRGSADEADGYFARVRRHPCCRKRATAQLAQLARGRGDVTTAKQCEAEANALDPDAPWPDPYLDRVVTLQVGERGTDRRAALLERDGRFADAVQLYLSQAQKKPTAKAFTRAGVNLARMRDYEQAIAVLREAVRLDPADTNAHYTLALVLFNKAERLWVPDPSSAEAAGLFREVVASAKRTTELKPDHALAYLFWGLSLKNAGDPRGALDPLQKGLVIRPAEFELHLALGQCQAATGDRTGAAKSLEAAQKLKPDDPRPAQELAKLR